MEKAKTVKFLSETSLSVITCENDGELQDFLNDMFAECGKPIAECDASEADKIDLSVGEVVIVRGVRNGHGSALKLQIAQKITELNNVAKAHGVHLIVALERIDCPSNLVTAQLRGIWLRTPESDRQGINMFNLQRISKPHCNSDDFKLECEIGTLAGQYLLYNYRKQGFQLKEK